MKKMNIAVVGVGGVGGYFGALLCRRWPSGEGHHISFIARGRHLDVIREHGLIVKSAKALDGVFRPDLATDNFKDLHDLDLCMICVKEYDLDRVLDQLSDAIGPNTVVLPLMNGINVHQRIADRFPVSTILPTCVYIGTHIESPGVISQKGGECRIFIGCDTARLRGESAMAASLMQVKAALDQAEILTDWKSDVSVDMWSKFVFISAFALVTAGRSLTIGEVLQSVAFKDEVIGAMREIVMLAAEMGVKLPSNIIDNSLEKAQSFPFETKTSFQRDFEIESKPDERQLFAGCLIEYADDLRIQIPVIEEIWLDLNKSKPCIW